MSKGPIILLTFANDLQGQFLREISGEQRGITQAIDPLRRKNLCEILVLPDVRGRGYKKSFQGIIEEGYGYFIMVGMQEIFNYFSILQKTKVFNLVH